MDEREWLTERFQQHRSHLRGVAYRMLGSVSEADDALQEAWLRIRETDPCGIENMQAWLTTVVGRVCLNMLRARRAWREQLSDACVPDPVVSLDDRAADPEQEALVADSVGLALLVVLDALSPAERLAFVLHDVFGVPFTEVAAVLHRSEAAAQQLASRARRRVRGSPAPDPDLARQRVVVDAFFAASRDGDFGGLVAVLDPAVELRVDGGMLRRHATLILRGAQAVAAHSATYSSLYPFVRPALVNGAAGAVVAPPGGVFSVMAFTVTNGKIARIDALADPERQLPPSVDSDVQYAWFASTAGPGERGPCVTADASASRARVGLPALPVARTPQLRWLTRVASGRRIHPVRREVVALFGQSLESSQAWASEESLGSHLESSV